METISFKFVMELEHIFQVLPWQLKSDFQKHLLSI